MTDESLAAALEREHREIDEGFEEFLAAQARGERRTEPLTRAVRALRRHIYAEEELLFGPLREAGMMAPVFVMVREHGQMWTAMDALEVAVATGVEAGTVAELCRDLLGQLAAHNPKEEQILYPQTDAVLPGAAGAEFRAFLDGGQVPEGWVREAARL